jgi:hypothetical protein
MTLRLASMVSNGRATHPRGTRLARSGVIRAVTWRPVCVDWPWSSQAAKNCLSSSAVMNFGNARFGTQNRSLFATQTESEQARTLAQHVGEEIAAARLQLRLFTPATGARRIARFTALRTQ